MRFTWLKPSIWSATVFIFVTGGFVLIHGFLLVEGEGGDDEETVVVVSPEDLRDGQEFLLTFLPDLSRCQQVEDKATEEQNRQPIESILGCTGPVVGRVEFWTFIEQMLGEGGAVGTGILQSEVAERTENGHTDGSDQSQWDGEPSVLDVASAGKR